MWNMCRKNLCLIASQLLKAKTSSDDTKSRMLHDEEAQPTKTTITLKSPKPVSATTSIVVPKQVNRPSTTTTNIHKQPIFIQSSRLKHHWKGSNPTQSCIPSSQNLNFEEEKRVKSAVVGRERRTYREGINFFFFFIKGVTVIATSHWN